jgi:uncharacterized RDD family membrane protein YckC/predicted RNA-binding Zn-ribbon protein involved in translation (DUF1610 family)
MAERRCPSPPQLVKEKEIEPSEPEQEYIAPSGSAEEIQTKKEAGKKQCPTCGEWDVIKAYVEDGGMGDWCPHCKKSIKEEKFYEIGIKPEDIRPWVRYWARAIDILIGSTIIGFTIGLIAVLISTEPYHALRKLNEYIFGIICLLIWIPIEALLLSTWGYTPGKWLFKVTIRDQHGNKLTFQEAINRAGSVTLAGMGLGFPIISLITLAFAYSRLKNEGKTLWDRSGNFVVTHQEIGTQRVIIGMVFIIGVFFLLIIKK